MVEIEKKTNILPQLESILSDFDLVHVPKNNRSNDLQNAKKSK